MSAEARTALPASAPTRTPVERIEHFEKVILASQESDTFTCGGTLPNEIVDCEKLAIFYEGAAGHDSLTFPAAATDIERMTAGAGMSPFGRGHETVFDPTYRRASEYKPPKMAISIDILSSGAILAAIERKLNIGRPLRAVMSKLNMYGAGGFFKAHRDTALGTDHVGTITVCLPTAYTGGELVVRQDEHTATYDWSTATLAPLDTLMKWAFLFADVEHEVLPVSSGTRLTIAYDVFYADTTPALFSFGQDIARSPVYAELVKLLDDDKLFLPVGGTIAFGFRHAYPQDNARDLAAALKGVDKHLFEAIRSCGLCPRLCVAFDFDLDLYGESIEESYDEDPAPSDEDCTSDQVVDIYSVGRRLIYLTSADFESPTDMDIYEDDPACWLATRGRNVAIDKNAIWITDVGAYGRTDSYISYGNEAVTETLYTGVCLFVDIPSGEARRAR